jgi:hypothetical protein
VIAQGGLGFRLSTPPTPTSIILELSATDCVIPAGARLRLSVRNHYLVKAAAVESFRTVPLFVSSTTLVEHSPLSASRLVLPLRSEPGLDATTTARDMAVATYAWGGFQDLGGGLAGTSGVPALTGTGTFVAVSAMSLHLQGAAAAMPAAVVLGSGASPTPLFGGVLVPTPEVVVFTAIDAGGQLVESFAWPTGLPARWTFTSQCLVLDAGANGYVAFSNALRGVSPP